MHNPVRTVLELRPRAAVTLEDDFVFDPLAGPRLSAACRAALAVAMRRSILLSVDMAHAVHPNYAHKHDGAHAPRMNHGLVIKTNTNQRYATNGVTGFVVRELGRRAFQPEEGVLRQVELVVARGQRERRDGGGEGVDHCLDHPSGGRREG